MPGAVESVVIVGGGASAVLVTAALVQRATASATPLPTITVVGDQPSVGLGVAYGRAQPHHLLNSPAGKMSVSIDYPDDFLEWAETHEQPVPGAEFVPRQMYGRYLVDTFQTLSSQHPDRVRHVQGRAVAIQSLPDAASVRLADGSTLTADAVVLAVGTPPPAAWTTSVTRVIDDPWAPDALDGVGDDDRVLLIGTGLTMVDVATSLARRHPRIHLTATSRHLLLPHEHTTEGAGAGEVPTLDASSERLGDVVGSFGRAVRSAHEAQTPWQLVIDGFRPRFNPIWSKFSEAERVRFIGHLSRWWDVHRHRLSPSANAQLHDLLDRGVLRVEHPEDPAAFDVVVNCTGPRSVGERGWNDAVDSLLDAGAATPDRLQLGLDSTPNGQLVHADGSVDERVWAIGLALRGTQWETVAVNELRAEATAIAVQLLSGDREPIFG